MKCVNRSLLRMVGWVMVLDAILPLPLQAYDRNTVPFRSGEKLTYHFYWGPFLVGHGVFEVKDSPRVGVCELEVRVQSNEFISSIYPVEDVLRSFYDLDRNRSEAFIQDRKEGRRRIWEEVNFDYTEGKGTMESRLSGEKKLFEIPTDGVHDKLSTIYSMRCLDWKERDEARTVVGSDKKNLEIHIKKVGKELLELEDFTPIPTFKVEPSTEFMGGFVKKGKMRVWVTDDELKIPVRVESRLSVGSVDAVLVKVEGVKDWSYSKPED